MRNRNRRPIILVILSCIIAMVLTGCSPSSATTASSSTTEANFKPSEVVTEVIASKALGRELTTLVYLPPDYDPEKVYPVVYLFHGHGADQEQWLKHFQGQAVLDALIGYGEIPPMIAVCPQVDASYGLNSDTLNRRKVAKDGSLYIDVGMYEDYLLREVLPTIESKYAISKDPTQRSIGGFSMGGHMALRLGFDHPELFGRIGAHAAPIKTEEVEFVGIIKDTLYPTDELRKARDPYQMADNLTLEHTSIYLDIGKQDSAYHIAGYDALCDKLLAQNIDVQFYMPDGGHDANFIVSQLVQYLKFYAGL